MARGRPVAIAAVVLVSLAAALAARASEPLSAAPENGPPSFVSACLALSTQELGPCFRRNAVAATAAGELAVRESGAPPFVAKCLSVSPLQRGACFRQEAAPPPGTPSNVAKCLGLATRRARNACFRALVPSGVAHCLTLRTRKQRTDCFKKLRRP